MRKSDIVTVTCYGRTETMTRGKAMAKYLEGMMCCGGSEQERYATIYYRLAAGLVNVNDGV